VSPGYPPYYMGGSAPPPEPPTKHPHRGRRDDEDGEADKENERKERGEERRLLATLAAQVGRWKPNPDRGFIVWSMVALFGRRGPGRPYYGSSGDQVQTLVNTGAKRLSGS
jgi:hypothetical protein